MDIKFIHKKGIALILFILIFLLNGCSNVPKKSEEMNSTTSFYFNTVITISADTTDEILSDLLTECNRYEKLLSRTVEGSDVWNINNSNGAPIRVSDETMEILLFSQKISEETNGAFDITIAPYADLWSFSGENPKVPSDTELNEAKARVGYKNIRLFPETNTVEIKNGASIDLGGIAKGFIADKIGEELLKKGVKRAILNFGGNVLIIGEKEDKAPWRVGVQDPNKPMGEFIGIVNTKDSSTIVTSGVYERGFVENGTFYHHLLDPNTGLPVNNGLASVTILSKSSMVADAYSTACFVLGPERGMEFAEKNDSVEAVFIYDNGEAVMTKKMSSYYENYLEN